MSWKDPATERDDGLATARRKKTRRPRLWRVLLHNDDYTSMEFVVHILRAHFGKAEGEATQIMLEVHYKGVGIAGIYPKEIAETKVAEVSAEARAEAMPLLVSLEPAEETDA